MKSLADRLRKSLVLSVAAATLVGCAASPEPSWEIPLMEVPPFTEAELAELQRPFSRYADCDRHGCPAPIPFGKADVAFEISRTETPGKFKVYYRNSDNLNGAELAARVTRSVQPFCDMQPDPREVVIISSGPRPSFLEREFTCATPAASPKNN